jgi:hypothetical protein
MDNSDLLKSQVLFKQLPKLEKRISEIEEKIKEK